MEKNTTGTKEKNQWYEYKEFPKNVRQIGVPLPGTKIYLEDYVITYLKQEFVEMNESKVAVLVGKRGIQEAQQGIFVYGAIALEEEQILENGKIEKETWDKIHEKIHENFSGAQILGWACGVSIWNSEMDQRIRRLQRTEFAREDNVMFLWDLCEKEEKIFLWQRNMIKEMSGYYVFFEKNPQMQEFMLDKQNMESIDGDYQDTVTTSMRHVMEEKEEEKQKNWQIITYCGAVAAGIAVLFCVHMMMESSLRIHDMEQTVNALSQYVDSQQEEMETMAQQAEDVVKQIPYENQNTENPENKEEKSETQEQTETQEKEEAETQEKTESQEGEETGTQEEGTRELEKSSKGEKSDLSEKDKTKQTSASSHTNQSMIKHQAQSYIVQKGDTLSQIVWKQYHDASYEKKVKKVNDLSDADKIYVGQCLILPAFEE